MRLQTVGRLGWRRSTTLVLALAVLATATAAQGKGKGGGKGEEPPPDPAIVYVEHAPGAAWADILVMNEDGSNRTLVLAGAHHDVSPSFSADGTEIVFADEIGGWGGIWAVGVDGQGLRFIAPMTYTPPALYGNPRWSPTPAPDGSEKIVYADRESTSGSLPDLFLVNPDGTGFVQLTDTPEISEHYPVFAPTGDRIAFSEREYENGAWRLGVFILELGLDGAGNIQVVGKTPVTSVPGSPLEDLEQARRIAWANDNPWIVVSAGTPVDGGRYLWLVDLDLPQYPFRVSNATKSEWYPNFTPDDSAIVYYSIDKKLGIAQVSVSGTNVFSLNKRGERPNRRSF